MAVRSVSKGPRTNPAKNGKFKVSMIKKKEANISGFQKRIARKPQGLPRDSNLMDVYEFDEKQGGRRKGKGKDAKSGRAGKDRIQARAAVSLDLTREEAKEFALPMDDEENDEDDEYGMEAIEKIRKQIQMGDETVIDSEDDEDIDSDEAFDESDEDRFAHFNLKSNKSRKGSQDATSRKKAVHFHVNLDENEDMEAASDTEDEESESEDEDDKDEWTGAGNSVSVPESAHAEDSVTSSQNESDSNDKENEEDILSEGQDHEDDPQALQTLGTLIDTLGTGDSTALSAKRKASELDEEGYGEITTQPAPQRKKRMLKERTQAGQESEFSASNLAGAKLQFSDLIAPLASEGATSSLIALTSAAKALQSTKSAPLSAPLPTRIQDRLDRKAAYEQTKAEVQKWEPTMKRIREADHLSFPLQTKPKLQSNVAELASAFKPATKLESAVDKLLKDAELREQDIAKIEDLQMQHLTPEEVAQRRLELRRNRDLMFRAEIKAKRIAKIKSKAYRKIQKKEKLKQAEKLKDMGIGDVDEEEERLKAEAERAKERATLKHKNTGKWANSMRSRAELDEDQRQELQEMYDRGEKLKKKIAGINSDDEDSEEESDEENADGVRAATARALKELDDLDEDEDQLPSSAGGNNGKSGLMEMKFMQNAALRDKAQTHNLMDSFKEELQKLGEDEEGNELPQDDLDLDGQVSAQRFVGRVSFNPGAKVPQALNSTSLERTGELSNRYSPTPMLVDPSDNPWLNANADIVSTKISRASNKAVVGKGSNAASISKNALKKRLRKTAEAVAQAKDDATLEIDVNSVLTFQEKKTVPAKPEKSHKGQLTKISGTSVNTVATGNGNDQTARVDPMFGQDEDTDEEREAQEEALNNRQKGNRVKAFEQRELVARAFAGDNVMEEFAAEKMREMDEDAPKEVDTTLPGWGSWGGAGITKRPPKPERIKRFPGIDPKKRQDHGKDHVIISEKKDKKADKYLVKDLPFPYTSKAQFERRLEVPLGVEWNTRATFQKATLPRVVKKMGAIIEPLEKLF